MQFQLYRSQLICKREKDTTGVIETLNTAWRNRHPEFRSDLGQQRLHGAWLTEQARREPCLMAGIQDLIKQSDGFAAPE